MSVTIGLNDVYTTTDKYLKCVSFEFAEMKVVILCGGKGSRMGQACENLPKPLIEIGNKPVLWHIMKFYSAQGYNEFILLTGYKKDKIQEYFDDNKEKEWDITFVDTGLDTSKSKRILQIKEMIDDNIFFLSYGDDLSDIDLSKLRKQHESTDHIVTLSAVRLVSQFGIMDIDKDKNITSFKEKPVLDYWMNGGFMIVNKKIFDYLHLGELEEEVFNQLVMDKMIGSYQHYGNWKTMNTLKDNIELNQIWESGNAFWRLEDA